MAKGHTFELVSLWIGDKKVELANQKIRLRFGLGFTTKHDGDVVGTDHRATFDLTMLFIRLLELAKNSIAIAVQNKILRPMTSDKAKAWLKAHDPIGYDDAFPGKSTVVRKVMSDEEIKAKAKADPEYRAQLLEELMAMEDQDDLEDDIA